MLNFVIANIVHLNYPSGAVIDARGIPNASPTTSMTCPSSQPSPCYAYETVSNKPIIAGKTKDPDVITLEPGSLGGLAAGARARK